MMVAVMAVAVVVVTVTEDLAHFDESVDIQVRHHCMPSNEKTEIYVYDCGDGHVPFRRLGAGVYHSPTTNTVLSISLMSSFKA